MVCCKKLPEQDALVLRMFQTNIYLLVWLQFRVEPQCSEQPRIIYLQNFTLHGEYLLHTDCFQNLS